MARLLILCALVALAAAFAEAKPPTSGLFGVLDASTSFPTRRKSFVVALDFDQAKWVKVGVQLNCTTYGQAIVYDDETKLMGVVCDYGTKGTPHSQKFGLTLTLVNMPDGTLNKTVRLPFKGSLLDGMSNVAISQDYTAGGNKTIYAVGVKQDTGKIGVIAIEPNDLYSTRTIARFNLDGGDPGNLAAAAYSPTARTFNFVLAGSSMVSLPVDGGSGNATESGCPGDGCWRGNCCMYNMAWNPKTKTNVGFGFARFYNVDVDISISNNDPTKAEYTQEGYVSGIDAEWWDDVYPPAALDVSGTKNSVWGIFHIEYSTTYFAAELDISKSKVLRQTDSLEEIENTYFPGGLFVVP